MSTPNDPMAARSGAQPSIVVERTYRASLAEIWALWTARDGFESWWGPEGFRVEVRTLEAREGGALAYDMIADTPDAIAAMRQMGQPLSHDTKGRFAAVRPMEHLRLVHLIDFIAGKEPYEVAIEVGFEVMGEEVRMTVTLEPHPDPHWTKMSSMGFASQIGKLDRRFGSAA